MRVDRLGLTLAGFALVLSTGLAVAGGPTALRGTGDLGLVVDEQLTTFLEDAADPRVAGLGGCL